MGSYDERRTARLLLSRITHADFDDLFRMHRDPRVMATLGGLKTDDDLLRRAEFHLHHWAECGFGWWIWRDLATGQFVGRGGLRRMVLEGKEETEIGYGLIPGRWGQGLATEVASEAARVAFEEMGLTDLVCFTLPTNRGSRRVMEKVGFKYERDGFYAELPHVFYRLTAEEWREKYEPEARARVA